MSKRQVLECTTFGHRIAEEEVDELANYFVETEDWRRIYAGDVDIVYGPKGSGKSAIYSLLLKRREELFDRDVLIIPAENPRGAPAFADLKVDPPTTERGFVALWKVYLLALTANALREYGIGTEEARTVVEALEDARIIDRDGLNLRSVLKNVQRFVRRLIQAESVEGGVSIDPNTGTPMGLSGKITLAEPSPEVRDMGVLSVDSLFEKANAALEDVGFAVWLVIDRLDVAFADTHELERNALRALFRTYLDLLPMSAIRVKVFLRSDIWQHIVDEGFREASHITRAITIRWDSPSLLNLVIRRILRNEAIRIYYEVDEGGTLGDIRAQEKLFYRVFPDKVDAGSKKPMTFDWMLSRTQDGSQQPAPRELIHLLSSLREQQLRRLELGLDEPPDEHLFDRQTFKDALPEVSRTRLEQTLYAEYPSLKPYLVRLQGEKTQQRTDTLSATWDVPPDQALTLANKLAEVGFFEKRGSKEDPEFWVPFLYRDALGMVQGSAE